MAISALVFYKKIHCAGGDPKYHYGSYNDAFERSQERILVNDQLDALFLNVFILCLYMFRAASAH
jgi:hypothetical protein